MSISLSGRMALCRKSGKIKILHSKLLQQVMYKCWNAIYNIYHQLYFSGRVYACRIYWNVVLPILSTFAVTILMGDLWSSPLLGSWLWVYEIQTEKVKKYSCTVSIQIVELLFTKSISILKIAYQTLSPDPLTNDQIGLDCGNLHISL